MAASLNIMSKTTGPFRGGFMSCLLPDLINVPQLFFFFFNSVSHSLLPQSKRLGQVHFDKITTHTGVFPGSRWLSAQSHTVSPTQSNEAQRVKAGKAADAA